jgi:hypothetical protein
MTASAGVLRRFLATEAPSVDEVSSSLTAAPSLWDPNKFGDEQIRSLVRRIFLPGWPRPARQVVFSALDDTGDLSAVCARVARALSMEGAQRVCLVETDFDHRRLEQRYGRTGNDGNSKFDAAGALRESSRQISNGVWLAGANEFLGESGNLHNVVLVRSRFGQLRREFDYSVIHAASLGTSGDAALLGHVADGLIVSVEANRTRRATAVRIRERLLSANVRLLGVVLQERTFPIPQVLYQRL